MHRWIQELVVIYEYLNSGNISVRPVSDIFDHLLWITGGQHDVILVHYLIIFVLPPDHPPPDKASAKDTEKKNRKDWRIFGEKES